MRRIRELDRETAGALAEEILAVLEERETAPERDAEPGEAAFSKEKTAKSGAEDSRRKKQAGKAARAEGLSPRAEKEALWPQLLQEESGAPAARLFGEQRKADGASEAAWQGTEAQMSLLRQQADRRMEDRSVRQDAEALSRFLCRESRRYDTGFTRY